jgi:hypothetical protein
MSVPPLPDAVAPPLWLEPPRPPSAVAMPPLVDVSPPPPFDSVLVKAGPLQAAPAAVPATAMNVAANSALGRNRASKDGLSPELLRQDISADRGAPVRFENGPKTAEFTAKSALRSRSGET